ncbi:hypothetical protein ACFVHI_26930 [Kitasatospora sp. NPDC127121]|uniref:hypothetical protein n=1 Tax=Kitasatospora sp. NPDC127121 TaxID=3345371 RepID=UPI00363CCBA8
MFVRAGASASTALNYLVTTAPSPLEITPADTTFTPATISVTAANPGPDPVRVVSVKFTLLAGTGAGALTEHLDQIHATVTPGTDWSFTNGEDGTFLAMPTGDQGYVEVTDKAVLFELTDIAVNGEIGVTTLDILERTQDDEGDTSKGTAEFQLGKCFPGFQFSDLTPAFLDDGHTTVTNGNTVTLTWTASHGAAYTMLHENKSYDVTNTRTWTSPTLTRDATFHLRASLTTDGHTVTHYLHTNVTVDKPDLELGTLTVNGDAQVSGQSNVQGLHCAQTLEVGGEIHVAGTVYGGDRTKPVTLYGAHVTSALTVDGNLSATGTGTFGKDLSTTGGLTAGGTATVAGNLTANSAVTVKGSLTADGGATINHSLSVTAVTDMLANHYMYFYPKAASFSKTAPTDGLLTVMLLIEDHTGKDNNVGLPARLYLTVGGYEYWVDAPILRQSGTSGQRHPMSFLVRQGQTISGTLADVDHDVDMSKVATTLYWFPIGKSLELT